MLIVTHLLEASWLPPGGTAEVALASPDDPIPLPMGLVRLLVTDTDGQIFCVPRAGGRDGLDLPTAAAGSATPAEAVRRLTASVLGDAVDTEVVGCVRNIVAEKTSYEWPSPLAHFAVVRPTALGARPVIDGVWVDRQLASTELGGRHWWPLISVDYAVAFEIREELAAAWGCWIGEVEQDRDRIEISATDALVAGLDSPALRELAGVDIHAAWSEIDSMILRASDELGMPTPTRDSGLHAEMTQVSRRVLAGAPAYELTGWAHLRIGHSGRKEWQAPVRLDDEYELLEEVTGYWEVPDRPARLRLLDGVIRQVAEAILAGEQDLHRFTPARWR